MAIVVAMAEMVQMAKLVLLVSIVKMVTLVQALPLLPSMGGGCPQAASAETVIGSDISCRFSSLTVAASTSYVGG